MKFLGLWISITILASSLLFNFGGVKVYAQSLEESEKKLQDLQKQIFDTQQQLDQLKSQETTLKSQLAYIDGQTTLTNLKIEETNTRLAKLTLEIKTLSDHISRLSSTVDSISELLLNRIVETYKYGALSPLELFFSSHGFGDAVSRIKYIQVAQNNDKKILYQLQATKQTYNDQRVDKEARQRQEEQLKRELAAYQKQLDEQKAAKKELLMATQNDEAKFQSLLAQLRADANSIRRALGGTGVKVGQVKKGDVIASIGMTGCTSGPHLHFEVMKNAKIENNTTIGKENKVDPKPYLDTNQLEKPLSNYNGQLCLNICSTTQRMVCNDGNISATFGATGDCYLKGYPPHTGLDITDPVGTMIHAAADGIAYEFHDTSSCTVYGVTRPPGRGIAIDHGNGLVTLYWHIL